MLFCKAAAITLRMTTCMLMICCFVLKTNGQVFFNDNLSKVYKAEFNNLCNPTYLFSCVSPGTAQTDIAYFNDTVYLVDGANNAHLFRSILSQSTPQCTLLGTFSHWVTSLAVDSLGVVYAAGESLSKYTPSNGSFSMVGTFPAGMYSGGDLTYYKGQMYMYTSSNTLVQVDVNNPSLSSFFMSFTTPNIYGGITLPKSCNTNSLYAISSDNTTNTSKLIEIDMDNKVEMGTLCTYNKILWGAGSFVGSPPAFDSIKLGRPCSNEGNNGSIQVQVKSPNILLTYTLNGAVSNKTGVFTNLVPGTYTINVSNGIGCSTDTMVTLTMAQSPSFSATPIHPNCVANNGQIVLQPPSSTMNGLLYSINHGSFQPVDTFKNLAAGYYSLQVSDTNACKAMGSATLVQPTINRQGFSIAIASTTCGISNGSIQVTVNNLVQPVSYRFNGINYSSGSFSGLSSAFYTLSVLDGNLCSFDTVINILPSVPVKIDSIIIKKPCSTSDGIIKIFPQVPMGMYNYYLNGTANSSGIFGNLQIGAYTIRLETTSGCFKDSVVTVQQAPLPSFSQVVTQPTCSTNGQIAVQATSNVSNTQFSFNGGSYAATSTFSNLVAGNYNITAQNELGCTASTTINLFTPSINKSGIQITSVPTSCGRPNGHLSVATSNVVQPVSFTMNGVPTANGQFSNLSDGQYQLSIIDGNHCRFDTTIHLVNIEPIKPIVLSAIIRPICDLSANGSIHLTITGSEGPYSLSQNGGPYSMDDQYNHLNAGIYQFRIKNNNDCLADTLTVDLKATGLQACDTIFFPTAFTPNNDQKNDLFKGIAYNLPETYYLAVYNRLGQKVFETKSLLKGWDGTVNGVAQHGTFIWVSQYSFFGKTTKNAKGTLVLLR